MAAPLPSGAGMLAAHSRLAQPEKCPPEQYERWYFEDHIPDVLSTSGIKKALFYTNVDPGAERPYLALYPLQDLPFLQSDEFIKGIRVTSPLLPKSEDGKDGLCYDYMDVDVAYLQHVQTYEPARANAEVNGHAVGAPATGSDETADILLDPTKCIVRAAIEPGPNTSDEEFDRWYREEHNEAVSQTPGYVRTTRYKVAFARSNLMSRVLKGFATEEERAQAQKQPEMPRWLACHEFDTTDLDWSILGASGETEWSKKIMGDAKVVDATVWKLKKAWGQ